MRTNDTTRNFDTWIVREYSRLRERLSLAGAFDEDAFHDAYISVRESLLTATADDYFGLFKTAYRKVSKRYVNEAFATYSLDDSRLVNIPSAESVSVARDLAQVATDIRAQVKRQYNPMIVLIWESYVLRNMTVTDICDISGMGRDRVKTNINRVNSEMRQMFADAI